MVIIKFNAFHITIYDMIAFSLKYSIESFSFSHTAHCTLRLILLCDIWWKWTVLFVNINFHIISLVRRFIKLMKKKLNSFIIHRIFNWKLNGRYWFWIPGIQYIENNILMKILNNEIIKGQNPFTTSIRLFFFFFIIHTKLQ